MDASDEAESLSLMIASLNIKECLFGLSSAMMSSYQQQSSRYRCMAALLQNSVRVCYGKREFLALSHLRHWSEFQSFALYKA
jgi:hypothetical protein